MFDKLTKSDASSFTVSSDREPEPHMELASKIATEIVDRFSDHFQQNQMLMHIHGYIKEQRICHMKSLQEKIEILDKSLSEIK